ncbi:MAG: hypothetical protein EA392_12730 [Cryomorphaceae bacterium]|nr:MAG: hypothetical protein EA392_12730 [Cryomorphaceae bacterium]
MIKTYLVYLLNELGLYFLRRPLYSPVFNKDEKKIRSSDLVVSARDKRWWNRRGFHSDKALYYDRQKAADYISDMDRRILTERINKLHRIVVHDKFVFYRFMDPVADVIPVLILIQRNGKFVFTGSEISSIDDFLGCLFEGLTYVVKPIDGGGGRNVESISYSTEKGKILVGKTEIDPKDFTSVISKFGRAIIQPKVFPSGYSREIFPHSLNTMRVITMIDPDTKEPFIAAVSHKFGTTHVGVIDNWKQGGFLAKVDENTGEIGHGYLYPRRREDFVPKDSHPDSGFRAKGYVIPNWSSFVVQMKDLASHLEFLAFVGWDVAWDGEKVLVVEANYNPDMSIIQCFGPLLERPGVRKFYEHHGVIQKGK